FLASSPSDAIRRPIRTSRTSEQEMQNDLKISSSRSCFRFGYFPRLQRIDSLLIRNWRKDRVGFGGTNIAEPKDFLCALIHSAKRSKSKEWSQIERTDVDQWQEQHPPQRPKAWLVFSRNSD